MSAALSVLRSALELHVLEPEDVLAAGHPAASPDHVLAELVRTNALTARVKEALERLVQLSSTLPSTSGAVARGTVVPADSEPAVPQAPGGSRSTFAPEQDGLQPVAPIGPATGQKRQTFAPEQDAGPAIPAGPRAGGANQTFAAERGGAAPGTTRAVEAVGLMSLGPEDEAAIHAAAWLSIAVRLGRLTREQVTAAVAEGALGALDRLVGAGTVSFGDAAEMTALAYTLRGVCQSCLALMPDDMPEVVPCNFCGRPWKSGPRVHSGITVQPGGGATQGIEGFPGEGGNFAGFELIERVAEGGMGVVFKARQVALNRLVALKVMRGGSLASKVRRRRFLLEAESAASLKHPGIVPVHDIDEVAGYPFYTMDFVEGRSLDKFVSEKKLGPRETASLLRLLTDAVHHFHLHGIVHRDLKPDNILVGADGIPKIIDFGIAKKLDSETKSSATIEGDVLGTLRYMSPEQATGRTREVDTRTDVYALGAILYELLAGAPPFAEVNDAGLLAAIQQEDPEPIRSKNPRVDGDLEAIVFRAMAKERERRYQSALELADDLDKYEKQLPIKARPATLIYRLRKTIRRRFPAFIASVVSVAFVGVGVAIYAYHSMERRDRIAALLASAADPALLAADREKTLQEVLFLDPENALARGRLDVSVAERKGADDLAKEKERQKQQALESQLAREHAEREANAAKDREQARAVAEAKARADSDLRAKALLEEATQEKTELTAIRIVGEALALVPAGPGELRSRIEDLRIELELRQTRSALAANQTGLADYWLQDARKLGRAASRETELAALSARIAELSRGQGDLELARGLLRAGDLIGARTKFEQARRGGIADEAIQKELVIVESRSLERARSLAAEGRSSLNRGDATQGLSKANQALQYTPGLSDALALVVDSEETIARDARARAVQLASSPEGRQQALAVLDQAVRLVKLPRLLASLRRERAARDRLMTDASLAGLVFIPEVTDDAFYMQRTLVTNREYRDFVEQKGYERKELWDPSVRDHLDRFRDGCAGGECTHRAPRSWVNGSYGDESNAARPVRGVTFEEARAYARWLSEKSHGTWRLPTAREWEVADGWDPAQARLRVYPWGDTFDASAIPLEADVALPVGARKMDVSALGIEDAAGNLRKWVTLDSLAPGTKGVGFLADERTAHHYASIRTTGEPGPTPSVAVTNQIGFRLVREIEVDR